MPAKKNIFIFGDSITYGEWDELGGWANRLRTHYDRLALPLPSDFVISYNLGIPSDTSTGVAERLSQETQSRLTPNPSEKDIQFVIAIGTNDSRWMIDENVHGVNHEQFKANLKTITNAATVFSKDIVFVGLLPCIEADVMATAGRHQWDVSYDNQSIKTYNEMLKEHCVEANIDFIDLFTVFEDNDVDSLFTDGLHPNSKGHALIYKVVIEYLNKT